MKRTVSWVGACFTVVLLACGEDETAVREDQGPVCWSQTEAQLQAVVPLQECLSATCDLHRHSECSLSLEADGIRVRSRFSYVQKSGSCTPDCGLIAARCTMPLPPSGTYRVLLGDQDSEITLPLVEAVTSAFSSGARLDGDPCQMAASFGFEPPSL